MYAFHWIPILQLRSTRKCLRFVVGGSFIQPVLRDHSVFGSGMVENKIGFLPVLTNSSHITFVLYELGKVVEL
jgi:hypothetical protein